MSLSEREALAVEAALRQRIGALPSAIVALSGGVDSTVVAAIAAQELGARAIAVTGLSESLAEGELPAVEAFCARLHLRHVTVETRELERTAYVQNSPDRCYHCKTELFNELAKVAKTYDIATILDGTNADDTAGHRPGSRAGREHGVVSPLVEVGAGKAHVRAIARRLSLPNAERPSSPCLSSRIAYGVSVTPERLTRVGAAERYLRGLGLSDVRVRLHDAIARVEVPKHELGRLVEHAPAVVKELERLGFTYVTLDLAGLRSGSLLEVFQERP